MKECPVFMEPTWCVCASQGFWDDYNLEIGKYYPAKCVIVISKAYPNLRFCITFRTPATPRCKATLEGLKYEYDLSEVRDPWQVGGEDRTVYGSQMFEKVFSFPAEKFLRDINEKLIPLSEIVDGQKAFYNNDMEHFEANLTNLRDGWSMFANCKNLRTFTAEFPKLLNSHYMFSGCKQLESFSCDLPLIVSCERMFLLCENLLSFECSVPNAFEA